MTDGHHQSETDWRETLRTAVSQRSEIGVARVVSALVLHDGQQIAARARAFLDDIAPLYLAEEGRGTGAMIAQRLREDLFQASVLAYMEYREADVELTLERDIPDWLDSNAAALLSANLRKMEAELGEPGAAATHFALVKLHQLFDLETLERLKYRTLEQVWSGIEATMADLLAAAAR